MPLPRAAHYFYHQQYSKIRLYMSFNVSSTVYPDHVRVDATGDCSLPQVFEFIENVKNLVVEAGRRHVLIDIRGVKGSPSDTDLFYAGKQVADVFGSRFKIAIVHPSQRITSLGQMAAVNRGARVVVVPTEDEAFEWLLAGNPNDIHGSVVPAFAGEEHNDSSF